MAGELKPPRVRPAIKRIAIWVTPVLLLIAAWQIWDAIEARRLEGALAPVLGPPVPMEIRVGGVDDGAGKYYSAAAMLAVAVTPRDRIQVTPGGPIIDAATSIRDALARGGLPTAEALDSASRQIEQGRATFDLLSRASALPFNGFAPGTEFNFRLSGLMDVNRLASLETMTLIMNGQADAAARVLVDRLRSLRAFDEEPSFFLSLRGPQAKEAATEVGILVARTVVSDARLDDLDRTLSQAYTADALERAIRREALWAYNETRSMWEGRSFRSGVAPLVRPALRHHVVMRLNIAADALAAARLPWPDRISAMNQIPERQSMVPEFVGFVAAFRTIPLVREHTVRMAEAVAAVRCARTIIAIERYRRAHNTLPDTLNDVMSPGDERTIDPFTGKALVYTQSEAGYVIYSVGSNRRDEGGTLSPDLSQGRLPGPRASPDVGVRVIPTQARQL